MATTRTVTVENTTEHPFDFANFEYGSLAARVPPARMETPAGAQVAAKKNGSAQVPEMLLARCVREPVVRFWFSSRDLILIDTTMDRLMSLEIPKAAGAQTAAVDHDEMKAMRARIAELEAAAKANKKETAPAK